MPSRGKRPVGVSALPANPTAEIRALKKQLRAALARAEQAAEAKAEFLANMSHEIRTPLTAVIGFAGLLAERPDLDETAGRYVARIGGAGRALLAIVNDVLDFSQLEAGRLAIAPRPARVIDAAREVLELFTLQAANKAIALRFDAAQAVPGHVTVDADRLRQILLSLVGNAVKFTARGTVTLRLGYDLAAERLFAEVTDTGPGIAVHQRKQIFQLFSQLDASTTRKGGAGMGLAISSGLAAAMGGCIRLSSQIGRGSTFRLELPAPPAEVAAVAAPGAWTDDVLIGLRVLVVDDNASNREVARAILEQFGVDISEAADGLEAVSLAQRQPFDLILMDMRMPGLDGRAALRRIRGAPGPNQAMPILAFSADNVGEGPDMDNLYEFQGRVLKPIQPSAMLAAISHAVTEDAAYAMESLDAAAV